MNLVHTILTIIDIIILVLSYTINNVVVWYKQDLNNFWFYIFIGFTIVNVIELVGTLTSYFYNPLSVIFKNEIKRIKTSPQKIIMNVLTLLIILMSVFIIVKNRQLEEKYYKYFGILNTVLFIFEVVVYLFKL